MSIYEALAETWIENAKNGQMPAEIRRLTARGFMPDFVPAHAPDVIAIVRGCAEEFPEDVSDDVRVLLALPAGGVS